MCSLCNMCLNVHIFYCKKSLNMTVVVFTEGKRCERQTGAVWIGDKLYRQFASLTCLNLVANENFCNFGQLCVRFLYRWSKMC